MFLRSGRKKRILFFLVKFNKFAKKKKYCYIKIGYPPPVGGFKMSACANPVSSGLRQINKKMAKIAQGKIIAQAIYNRLKPKIAVLKQKKITPKLGVVLVGEDLPSQTYVRKKGEAAHAIGVDFLLKKYSAKISTNKLIKELKTLQSSKYKLTGLIVQLPLPKHLDTAKILEAIKPEIDVDCLTNTNLGKLVSGTFFIKPPTPDAILEVLKFYNIEVRGKRVALIGAGHLIGRPLASMLVDAKATLSVINTSTKKPDLITKAADIIITGVGKKDLLTGKMIKKGAIVLDAGVCFENGKMYGNINFASVVKKAKIVTPTPGGIGPLTVAKLIENTVLCAENN